MGAVERAAEESKILGADIPAEVPQNSADLVRLAGPNTFKLVDGVWVDTRFDPEQMDLVAIPFLSDDYFKLADTSADIAAALALGDQVIIIAGEYAYQIVGSDEEGGAIEFPEATIDNLPPVDLGDESEVEASPEDDGINLGCPGLAFALGMVGVPVLRRKRRS